MTTDELRKALAARCAYPNTQKDLARKLGVSLSYLNQVLRGEKEPGPKMCAAIGVRRRVSYEKLAESWL